MAKGYAELPNEVVHAANGVEYAYRDTGSAGAVPLVLIRAARPGTEPPRPAWTC